jgi:MYND finger
MRAVVSPWPCVPVTQELGSRSGLPLRSAGRWAPIISSQKCRPVRLRSQKGREGRNASGSSWCGGHALARLCFCTMINAMRQSWQAAVRNDRVCRITVICSAFISCRCRQQVGVVQSRSACFHCGKLAQRMPACQRCRQAHFCSQMCQKAAWPGHKAVCTRIADAQKSPMQPCTCTEPYVGKDYVAFLPHVLQVCMLECLAGACARAQSP